MGVGGEPKGLGPVRKGCLEEAVRPRLWDSEGVTLSRGAGLRKGLENGPSMGCWRIGEAGV